MRLIPFLLALSLSGCPANGVLQESLWPPPIEGSGERPDEPIVADDDDVAPDAPVGLEGGLEWSLPDCDDATFAFVDVGEESTCQLVLTWRGTGPIWLRSSLDAQGRVQVDGPTTTILSPDESRVTNLIFSSQEPGSWSWELDLDVWTLESPSRLHESLTVPLSGQAGEVEDVEQPDDDDVTQDYAVEMTVLGGESEDLGAVGLFTNTTREVRIENVGTRTVLLSPYIDILAPPPRFELLGPAAVVLTPFSFQDYTVVATPVLPGVVTGTLVAYFEPTTGTPPGPFAEDVITFVAAGFDPSAGETECVDCADNDADGLIDCDDPECSADPACGGVDLCCTEEPSALGACADAVAYSCVCASDVRCCTGAWDASCASLYADSCWAQTCD